MSGRPDNQTASWQPGSRTTKKKCELPFWVTPKKKKFTHLASVMGCCESLFYCTGCNWKVEYLKITFEARRQKIISHVLYSFFAFCIQSSKTVSWWMHAQTWQHKKHIPHTKHTDVNPPPLPLLPPQRSFSFTQRLKIQESACRGWTSHGKKAVIFRGEVMETRRIRFQGHW